MFKQLLFLNGMATLGVIVFHAAGWGFVTMFSWQERYQPFVTPGYDPARTVAYYALRFMEQLSSSSISSFLFVSGVFIAFAAGRNQATVGWALLRSRIRNLVIPYLVWSLVLLTLLTAEGKMKTPSSYLTALLLGRTNEAYYYVPLLCQYYLLSPFLVSLARKHGRALLIGTALIQLVVEASYYPMLLGIDVPVLNNIIAFTPKWFFPTRLFWFSFGVLAGFNLKRFEAMLPRFRWPLFAAFGVLLLLGIAEWEAIYRNRGTWVPHHITFVDDLYFLTVILMVLAFAQTRIPASDVVGHVATRSYGIYLIHSPVMEYSARALYHFAPWMLANQALLQPIIIGAGLSVPLLIMLAANRSPARRYYKYSFG